MSGRFLVRASTGTALILVLLAGIEEAGRIYPRLMPTQWQVIQFAVNYPFHVLPDAELGFTMPPNQREVVGTADYTFLFETDANGYPNHDPWPRDPRVVFLGDSLIVGAGVGLDASFIGQLAGMLPGQSMLNLGLPGAGLERQARIFQRFGADWHPDLVVSCLFLTSDLENDFHFVSWLRDGQGTDYNTYRLRRARAERDRGILQRVMDNSLVAGRTVGPMLRWVEGSAYPKKRFRFGDGTEILFEDHALAFASGATVAGDPRLDTFVESLERLRQLVEQRGARLAVMLIPSKEELYGVDESRTRLNLASRIRDTLAQLRLPLLDLYPAVRKRGTARAPYYRLDTHLNEYGNRIVAEEFADWLARYQQTSE